jgi:hypothetical protein
MLFPSPMEPTMPRMLIDRRALLSRIGLGARLSA